MSKITLTPNSSGTGTFTVASPNSNTNRTLTLPDEAGELLINGTTSNVGIWTSSPQRALSIGAHGSSGAAEIAFGTSTTGYASLLFGDGTTGTALYDGYIQYQHNGGNMLFATGGGSERMRIDSSGAVTMPSQPAFLATKSAKQSNVAVNSQVTVVFETEVFDQNNDFTSSQFTAPVTGKYQLNLSLYTNELDSAADYYLAVIKTSNREYQNVIDPGVLASDPVYWNQGVSVLADMDANDTAYVFIQQGNGNQQADVATPTLFSGYLVA